MSNRLQSSFAAKHTYAPLFAALGHEMRLTLLRKLCDESPQSVSHLTEHMGLTRQGITKHLRVLEEAGIVESTRAGRESHYTLRRVSLDDIKTYLDDVSAQWDKTLARLKAFAES